MQPSYILPLTWANEIFLRLGALKFSMVKRA